MEEYDNWEYWEQIENQGYWIDDLLDKVDKLEKENNELWNILKGIYGVELRNILRIGE